MHADGMTINIPRTLRDPSFYSSFLSGDGVLSSKTLSSKALSSKEHWSNGTFV